MASKLGRIKSIPEGSTTKTFAVGTIVRVGGLWDGMQGDRRVGVETLDGRKFRSSYYSFRLKDVEFLTQSEIENMNKPKSVLVINPTSGAQTHHETIEAAHTAIGTLLKANPLGQFNVYQLIGVAKTKEIPVDFIYASNL